MDSLIHHHQDLVRELEQSHVVYLQTDDCPLKINQRNELEDLIEKFLCLVPNRDKYVFDATANILHRSAAEFKDFSGYKACLGWNAVSLYASNLLAQPWRKEYKSLKTYSGYYKYNIEANLIGAEVMFELMGYANNREGVLVLDGPIDPDQVSNVSRDALVAFVECKILKQIWEEVSILNVSWLEILRYRENHVGDANSVIHALTYKDIPKPIEKQREYNFATQKSYPHTPVNTIVHTEYLKYPEMQIQNKYTANHIGLQNNFYYPANKPFYASNVMEQNLCTCMSSTYVEDPMQVRHDTVPLQNFTKKLLANSFVNTTNSIIGNSYHAINNSTLKNYGYFTENYATPLNLADTSIHQENVLADEIDNINPESRSKIPQSIGSNCLLKKNSSVVNNINSMLKLNDAESFISDQTKKTDAKFTADRVINRDLKKNYKKDTTKAEPSLVADNLLKSKSSDNISCNGKTAKTERNNDWNCETCTYLNNQACLICEMCGKSRSKGNEDEPLVSGGKECPKCTLINKKDVSNCEACGTSLKDSPTYI